MAQIDVGRSYENGEPLLEADLDGIKDSIETFFNTTKVNDDNLQTNGINAEDKFIADSVVTALFDDEAVTGAKIAASAVTTAKFADLAVTTAKIADAAVTADKIASGTVVSADFADSAVTVAKRADPTITVTSATTEYSSTSTSEVDVTGGTVALTTIGKPVFVFFQQHDTSTDFGLHVSADTTTATHFILYRKLDAGSYSALCTHFLDMNIVRASTGTAFIQSQLQVGANSIQYLDLTATTPGTYTYKLAVKGGGGSLANELHSGVLVAYEVI